MLNGEFWVCDHLLNHLWGDLVISMVDGLLVPVLVAPGSARDRRGRGKEWDLHITSMAKNRPRDSLGSLKRK